MTVIYAIFICHLNLCTLAPGDRFFRDEIACKQVVERSQSIVATGYRFVCMRKEIPAWGPAQ